MRKVPEILIVDDNPENIRLLNTYLQEKGYQTRVAMNGHFAINSCQIAKPDLILMDIQMPELSGYETAERIKELVGFERLPIIFTSAMEVSFNILKAYDSGGVDYVTKPLDLEVLLKKIELNLKSYFTYLELTQFKGELENLVDRRTKSLYDFQESILHNMATLAEYRDNTIKGHIIRTQKSVELLTQHLSTKEGFEELDNERIYYIVKGTPLHDIGKIVIQDDILLKPGALTSEEYEKIKKHTIFGRDIILEIYSSMDNEVFGEIASTIALRHHEKWDGSGYPDGLKGKKIPICSRILAVIDVYDALISKRVYKDPMSHEDAVKIIQVSSGSHFDPAVVDAFMEIEKEIKEITFEYLDYDEEISLIKRGE